MSSTTEEIMKVCEALPPDKQAELADFARFLLARQDDEAWERRLADPKARPRLDGPTPARALARLRKAMTGFAKDGCAIRSGP